MSNYADHMAIASSFLEELRFPDDANYAAHVQMHQTSSGDSVSINLFLYDEDVDLDAVFAGMPHAHIKKGVNNTTLRITYTTSRGDLIDQTVIVDIHDMTQQSRTSAPLVTSYLEAHPEI